MSNILKPGERLRPLTSIIQNTSRTDLGAGQRLIPLSENEELLNEVSSTPSGPLQIELAGLPKVRVSRDQFDFIMDHLSTIKDKAEAEAEEIRIASALSFSRNTGLPLEYTLRNLDALTENYLGIEYKPTATAFRAIYNHGQIGRITIERGNLGKQLMETTDEGARQQLLQQAAAMDSEMENLQDSLPRNFIVEALKAVGESGYFTASSAIAGAEGAMIGRMGVELLVKAGLASTNPITGAVAGASMAIPLLANLFQGQNTQEIEAGNLYLDLLNSNVEEPIARHTANIGGYLSMAIEQGLGGLTSEWLGAMGVPTGGFTSKLITRMVLSGRLGEIGRFFGALTTGAVSEGLEEGMQGITTDLASDIAYTISQTANVEPDWNIVENFASDFIGAFASSLILGAPASAAIAHTDYQTARALEDLSMQVRSKEEYDRLSADLNPDESISDEDWKVITDTQFERGKEKTFSAFKESISREALDTTLTDLTEETDIADDDSIGGENNEAATVDRLADGRLYGYETGEARRLPRAFGQSHTFTYGSPRTGNSYGAVTYRTDKEGNLTITNVRARDGFQNLREEIVSDFISRFPDMNITWETNSNEEADIRTKLINNNPRGADYGLNYGADSSSSTDIQAVRTRIGTLFSEDDAVNSALAEVVELIGAKEGITGSEWLDRHIPEFRKWTAEEQRSADRGLSAGQHRTGMAQFYDTVDGVKAVVYAGEYANPTTFMHEMSHVLRRIGNNGDEFRKIFEKVRNDTEFQTFVNSSASIHNKDLSSLFVTENWTAADDEFFAELGEAYWTSGRTGNAELSGFFERIKRAFRNVYRAIRGTGKLNDEVRDYYDRLFGMSSSVSSRAQSQDRTVSNTRTAPLENIATDQEVEEQRSVELSDDEMLKSPAMPDAEIVRQSAVEADTDIATAKPAEPGRNTIEGWTSLRFTEAFNSITDNLTIRESLQSIPVSLHRAAGLVKISDGYPSATASYELDPRYSNLSEEDAAKMQRNADEYAAAVQKHDERQRGIIADGTVALDYTVNGKTYHMDAAAVDGLGMFTPVEYFEEAGLQDNPVRFSINADNVHIEGLEQPDPNVLWNGIPDRTPIMEEDEFADEYDPYESGLDEDGNPLYQTQKEAEELIQASINTAETHIPVEYSEAVWNSLFGENRSIETPIGSVTMGRNQFKKLADRKRTDIVGMIKPTLERPSFIIRESHGSNNGQDSFNYIKAFNDENGHRWLFSVVISQDDGWYVISNRGIHDNQVIKLILKEENSLAYVAADNQRTPSFVQRRESTGRPIDNLPSGSSGVNQGLFQTVEDITATGEWQETEIRLRANEANFDEAGRPLAPNGQLSRLPYREWVTVRTPSFINWFGDWMNDPENASKVVDENDEPLVVYHGSRNNFSVFDGNLANSDGEMGKVFYFTDSRAVAEYYASDAPNQDRENDIEAMAYNIFLDIGESKGLEYTDNDFMVTQDDDIYADKMEAYDRAEAVYDSGNPTVFEVFLNIRDNADIDVGFGDRYPELTDEKSATQYAARNPNQIKSIDNRGTFSSSPDIYYQTADGETALNKDLFVTHSLSESNLKGAIAIGGLVMPSLDITRTDPELVKALTGYGNITLIGSNRLGNQLVREGVVYNRDMWSPIFPRPEYTPNKRKLDAFINRLNKYAISDRRILSNVDAYSEYQYADPDDFAARLDGDNAHMAYAAEKGIPYETVYTHMPTDSYTSDFIVKAKAWLDKNRTRLSATGFDSDFENDMWNALRPYMKESFRERYGERFTQREIAKTNGIKLSLFSELNPTDAAAMDTEEIWDKILLNTQLGYRKRDMYSLMRLAESYDPETMIVDESVTMQNLRQALEGHDVRAWVREQIADAYSEPFLRIGRQKYPVTAENILRYMMKQNLTGNSGFIGTLSSAASNSARSLNTIQSLHDAENLLGLKGEGLDDEYIALVRQYLDIDNSFEAMNGMVDIIGSYLKKTSGLNKPVMRRLIMNDQWLVKRTNESADAFADFAEKLRNETRPYFEAKPQRILQLSDFMAAVVDDNVSQEARKILSDAGLDVIESTRDNRAKAVTDYVTAHGDDYLFQTMTDEEQKTFVEKATEYALDNPDILYQFMDTGTHDALSDYMRELMRLAAQYTDYEDYNDAAMWVIYDGDEDYSLEELDSYILEAWNKQKNPEAAGTDAPAKNPTLASPDLSATTEEMKDEEFVNIISTDEGFNEWLGAIQSAVHDPQSENERAVYEAFSTSNIIAPLINNLVFPSKRWIGVRYGGYAGSAQNTRKHAKAIASAKGILRANPTFYRDIYAKATDTDFWSSLYDDAIPVELQDMSLDDLKNISISERRRMAEGIQDENLKKAILSGTDTYNSPELARLIKRQEETIENARAEIRRLDEERVSLQKKYSNTSAEKQLLWRDATRLQAEIDNARERLSRISERIANASQNEFGEAGAISQKTIDQQASIAKQITELVRQQNSYLRQLKNEAVSDAVRVQYDKDLARMRDIRQKRDEKLRELKEYYQERERLQRVRNYKIRLADSIMREPSSGVNWTQAEKIRAIQAMLDPNFRKSIRIDGKTWDINLLKQMLRGEVDRDPVVFDSLKPEQLDKLSRKSLDEMTISELEDMASAISQLREDGIRERKAITSAERKRIASYRNQVLGVVMANPRYKDEPLPGTREDRELEKPLRKKLSSIYYGTANMSRRTQDMEGGEKGVIWQLLVGMKRDAQTERDRMILQRMEPINNFIRSHKIDRSRFYEYFQIMVDEKPVELRYSDLVYLYLSQNNQRNRDAEAYGMFVTQSEKEEIRNEVFKEIPYEGSRFDRERSEESNRRIAELGDKMYEEAIRQAEAIIKDESRRDLFELVRLVEADFNSDLFDRLREAEAKTYNIVVEKEDYYLPINRTDFAGSEPGEMVKQDLLNLIPENGNIQKGFLEDRQTISPYRQKPINTDFFGVWEKSVWAQEHALANMDYVRLIKGVFQNYGSSELQIAITNTFGKATMDAIDTHINQIANPDSYKKFRNNDEARILNFYRGSLYSSYLGFRLPSLVTQIITSPAPFSGAVQNPLRLAQGYFAVFSHPIEMWEEIKRLSPFMATRSMNPTLEWIQEEARRGDTPKLRRAISKFNSVGMMGLELVDRYAVAGGWWAIYQQERARLLTEGNLQTETEIEKAAAKVADEFVQETQPQSDITELSPLFQNRSTALQIITQFQTSLNVVWQNVTRDIPNAFRNKQYAKAIGMITGYVMSGLILYAVQEGFEDDDEDDEGIALWRRLLYAATTQPVSGIPLISDYVDALVEKITTGDTSGVYSSPVFPATDRIFKAINNIASKNWGKAAEQISDSLLLFSGLPYSLIRDLREMFDVEDGGIDIHPEVLIGRDPE